MALSSQVNDRVREFWPVGGSLDEIARRTGIPCGFPISDAFIGQVGDGDKCRSPRIRSDFAKDPMCLDLNLERRRGIPRATAATRE
jgi:hypothetical protein